MRTERNIKKKAQQQARVFIKMTQPRPVHRELTHADYTLREINAMCADGWHVIHCQLQRTVEVNAIEVRLTGDDIKVAEEEAIEAEAHKDV